MKKNVLYGWIIYIIGVFIMCAVATDWKQFGLLIIASTLMEIGGNMYNELKSKK